VESSITPLLLFYYCNSTIVRYPVNNYTLLILLSNLFNPEPEISYFV